LVYLKGEIKMARKKVNATMELMYKIGGMLNEHDLKTQAFILDSLRTTVSSQIQLEPRSGEQPPIVPVEYDTHG